MLHSLRTLSRSVGFWPLSQLLKVIFLKISAKVNLWTDSPILIEDASYQRIVEAGFTVKSQKDEIIVKHQNWTLVGIAIRRYTTDYQVFNLIFLEKELDLLISFIGSEKINIIVDAGANIGLAALRFEMAFPAAKIISIEPDSNNFAALEKNISLNRLNATAVKSAVWSKSTRLYFDRSFRDGGDWSVAVTENPNAGESIEAISFNQVMQQFDIPFIDLLKIDIEGSEREIFKGDKKSLTFLSFTKFIAVEVHEEVANLVEIENLLQDFGFELAKSGEYLIGKNRHLLSRQTSRLEA